MLRLLCRVSGRKSLATCIANLADLSNDWYSLQVACDTPPLDSDHFGAAIDRGVVASRIYGVTITNANVLDLRLRLTSPAIQNAGFSRTYSQFSSSKPMPPRACSVAAARWTSKAPTRRSRCLQAGAGVVAEPLRESQFPRLAGQKLQRLHEGAERHGHRL